MMADQERGIWSDEEMRSLMEVGAEESVFLKPWRFCKKKNYINFLGPDGESA